MEKQTEKKWGICLKHLKMHEYIIRKATLGDTAFLATTIIGAEKNGGDKLGLSTLYGIPEQEIHALLCNMLEEEVEECEFSISSFLIVTYNDEPVAALGGWIEGFQQKIKSSILKSNLVGFYFSKESIQKAYSRREIISDVLIDRENLTLQIEYLYVDKDHRGKGLAEKLIRQHIDNARSVYPALKKVQLQPYRSNETAVKLYHRCGFQITQSFISSNMEILDYLPHNERLLMEKELEQP